MFQLSCAWPRVAYGKQFGQSAKSWCHDSAPEESLHSLALSQSVIFKFLVLKLTNSHPSVEISEIPRRGGISNRFVLVGAGASHCCSHPAPFSPPQKKIRNTSFK